MCSATRALVNTKIGNANGTIAEKISQTNRREKMRIWKRVITLEEATKRCANTMVPYLGIEFVEMGEDYLVARMPVDHRTHQPLGIMHGGASCVLAETVGSTAAQFCVDEGFYFNKTTTLQSERFVAARDGKARIGVSSSIAIINPDEELKAEQIVLPEVDVLSNQVGIILSKV